MHKKLLLLITILIGIIIIIVITLFKKTNIIPPSQNPIAVPTPIVTNMPKTPNGEIVSINPNQTTADVIRQLGSPIKTEQTNDLTGMHYPAGGTDRENIVYTKGDKVLYISQEVTADNSMYTDYVTANKKTEDGILYDPIEGGAGFQWYIFAHDGIAFLANKASGGYVIRTLRFMPTDFQTYKATIAKQFNQTTTDPENVVEPAQ
jgi:hypothetical protein